jgi:hypothetical protein
MEVEAMPAAAGADLEAAVADAPASGQHTLAAHFLQGGKLWVQSYGLSINCSSGELAGFVAAVDNRWQLIEQLLADDSIRMVAGSALEEISTNSNKRQTMRMTVALLAGTQEAAALAQQLRQLPEEQQQKLLLDMSENSPDSTTAATCSAEYEAAFSSPVLQLRSGFIINKASKQMGKHQIEHSGGCSVKTPACKTTRQAVHRLKAMLLVMYKLQAVPAAQKHPALLQQGAAPVAPAAAEEMTPTQQGRAMMDAMASAGL